MAAQKKKVIKKTPVKKPAAKQKPEVVMVAVENEETQIVTQEAAVAPQSAAASQDSPKENSTPPSPEQKPEEDALPLEKDQDIAADDVQEEKIDEDIQEDKEELKEEADGEEGKGSIFRKILLWSFLAIVIGGLLGISWKLAYERGIVVGQEQMQNKMEKQSQTVEKMPAPTQSEIAKDKYTIEVLNGSGISGEAATVKTLLEKEGYTVSSVGNADNANLEETTISKKDAVDSKWMDTLQATIAQTYAVSVSGESLDNSTKTDVVVTVGSKKAGE